MPMCSICGQKFCKKESLDNHMKIHTGKTLKCPHKGCSHQATSKHNLKTHQISHSNEKKFKCKVPGCGSSFKRKQHLTRHLVKTHKNDPPDFGPRLVEKRLSRKNTTAQDNFEDSILDDSRVDTSEKDKNPKFDFATKIVQRDDTNTVNRFENQTTSSTSLLNKKDSNDEDTLQEIIDELRKRSDANQEIQRVEQPMLPDYPLDAFSVNMYNLCSSSNEVGLKTDFLEHLLPLDISIISNVSEAKKYTDSVLLDCANPKDEKKEDNRPICEESDKNPTQKPSTTVPSNMIPNLAGPEDVSSSEEESSDEDLYHDNIHCNADDDQETEESSFEKEKKRSIVAPSNAVPSRMIPNLAGPEDVSSSEEECSDEDLNHDNIYCDADDDQETEESSFQKEKKRSIVAPSNAKQQKTAVSAQNSSVSVDLDLKKFPLAEVIDRYKRFLIKKNLMSKIIDDYNTNEAQLKNLLGRCKSGKSCYTKFLDKVKVLKMTSHVSKGTKRTLAAGSRKEKITKEFHNILNSKKDKHLEIKYKETTGRSVVATSLFENGQYVAEYTGDLILASEGEKRELDYTKSGKTSCFSLFFKFNNKKYCIDASREQDGKMGRLLNHSRPGNVKPVVFDYNGMPRVVFRAIRNIAIGEELSYDYGDRENMDAFPWLKKRSAPVLCVQDDSKTQLNIDEQGDKEISLGKKLTSYFQSMSKDNALMYLSKLKQCVRANALSKTPDPFTAEFEFIASFNESQVDLIGCNAIKNVFSGRSATVKHGAKTSPQLTRKVITDYFNPLRESDKPAQLPKGSIHEDCLILNCASSSSHSMRECCPVDSQDISRIVNMQWLNNTIINSFCHTVLKRSQNKRIQFTSFGEFLLIRNEELTLTSTGCTRLEDVANSCEEFDSVVTVTNVAQFHFILWVCCLKTNKIFLFDSKKDLNLQEEILKIFNVLLASLRQFSCFQNLKSSFVNLEVPQQGESDNHSCGVAVCYFFKQLVNGHPLSEMINCEVNFIHFRQNILTELNSAVVKTSQETGSSSTASVISIVLDGSDDKDSNSFSNEDVKEISTNYAPKPVDAQGNVNNNILQGKQDPKSTRSSKCITDQSEIIFTKYSLLAVKERYKRYRKKNDLIQQICKDYKITNIMLQQHVGECRTAKSLYNKFINRVRTEFDPAISQPQPLVRLTARRIDKHTGKRRQPSIYKREKRERKAANKQRRAEIKGDERYSLNIYE